MPSGPKPKADAKRPEQRVHQFVAAPGEGWRHGDPTDKRRRYPKPPVGLLPASELAWDFWFTSWWASCWDLHDLPGIAMTIALYDALLRGTGKAADYTAHADRYGITPKGRQDLRWAPPKVEESSVPKVEDEVAKRRERAKRIS